MEPPRCKSTILREIGEEIEKGFVEEQNLERLETLEKIFEEEGFVLPGSVKEAYCRVAVECTARCLVCAEDTRKKSYTEAIRRIWIQRIMSLCESQSRLLTSELKERCQILGAAIRDQKARESLIEDNTRNKALLSLKRLVSDPLLTRDSSSCDARRIFPEVVEVMAEEEGEKEIAHMSRASKANANGREILTEKDDLRGSIHDLEQPKSPTSDGQESDAESSASRSKTISSPIYDRVLGDLRASKQELLDAMRKAGTPVLNGDEMSTEQTNASANPSAPNNASRPSMMERNITAHTYEWKDSIDDSIGESSGHDEKAHLSRPKRSAVSPLKSKETSKGARRANVPWTTAETLAIVEGYERHGPKWKLIKEENPILARRTNVDIKDRFRALKRHEEAKEYEEAHRRAT